MFAMNLIVNACEVDLIVVDKHYTVFAYVLNKHAGEEGIQI